MKKKFEMFTAHSLFIKDKHICVRNKKFVHGLHVIFSIKVFALFCEIYTKILVFVNFLVLIPFCYCAHICIPNGPTSKIMSSVWSIQMLSEMIIVERFRFDFLFVWAHVIVYRYCIV